MHSRREFLQRAAMLTGASMAWGVIPESIAKALAIDPDPGTTYLDAEHVVIVMQENRSFDHAYGALRGVRGFEDPRAFRLANGYPVWLQTNDKGETYCPFRMSMKDSRATWMGSLPHSWENQNDARNHGYYDKWLQSKANSIPEYAAMPMTLGYYSREDIPYYYALADAFTICDQHFCSSLTGTLPNRLYLWTGTVRATRDGTSMPIVRNEEIDYPLEASYTTFPERLEQAGVSWKVYQNEVNIDSGMSEDESVWLNNFSDNVLEWFTQYRIRHVKCYQDHLARQIDELPKQIAEWKLKWAQMADTGDRMDAAKKIADLEAQLKQATADRDRWTPEAFAALDEHSKSLHRRAFTVNDGDPDYRSLTTLTYEESGEKREVLVPKGDALYQFRKDVDSGRLPTVSWLISSEAFSDHPSSAWYGAWYVAEAMDILTKNPEVWKKTIFILTYDENDGYFDHQPPFTAPHPTRTETGKVSEGIDTSPDYLEMALELKRLPKENCREGSIGLGYRVPMVIASPWSRGGLVNSEVFDHTSSLQFLEKLLSHKLGTPIKEENIGDWRRVVCGDLTSTFQPYHGEKLEAPKFPPRDEFIEGIHRASYKEPPSDFHALTPAEIELATAKGITALCGPMQESGTRPSMPLAYELHVSGGLSADRAAVEITFGAGTAVFGAQSLGAPFNLCAYRSPGKLETRAYAVAAGRTVSDTWPLADFRGEAYHLRVDGPNGFLREFMGTAADPLAVEVAYAAPRSADLRLKVSNHGGQPVTFTVADESYGLGTQSFTIAKGQSKDIPWASSKSGGWYDITVSAGAFVRRLAGRVETGRVSTSDPVIGRR